MHAFRVVYPFVAVRSGPGTHFEKLGTKDKGDFVWVLRLEGGWASLARPEGAWMLVDGAALDLPVLLQPVPECCVPLVPRPDDCEVAEVAGDAGDAAPRPPRPPGRPRVLLVATSSHFVFDSWLDESDARGETRRMGAPNWGRRAGGRHPGQDKRAKFPTSKPHISAVFHSFRLIFGRAIISRNGLEA